MTHDARILGCIVGGAIGDAFGGSYEGQTPPIRIDPLAPWRLSDDTQLTLATCEAIAQTGTVDPAAIAERFKEWFLARQLSGLGASTLKALTELAHGGHWALVGHQGESAAGNGAAMRVAPLAFLLDPSNAHDRKAIRDVCRITHHHDEAYAGALAVALAVRAASDGTWTGGPGLLERIVERLFDCRVRDRLQEIARTGEDAPLADLSARFGCSGYVVESVPLAIRGAARVCEVGFESMLERLIGCGGDTDTIGSIAGQIAGTLVGYDGLPPHLTARLPEADTIERLAKQFCLAAGGKP